MGLSYIAIDTAIDHTNKKENKIFLIFKEIQSGAVEKLIAKRKSYMRKGFLIYEEMCKYLVI
jgi:hypothetical protein